MERDKITKTKKERQRIIGKAMCVWAPQPKNLGHAFLKKHLPQEQMSPALIFYY